MILFVLSFLAGALTILSPCIVPVLPFVFARVDQPFVRSGLPLLIGMMLSFSGIATLATIGGAWAAEVNDIGRSAAMFVLAAFGIAMLVPQLAEFLTRPLVALGVRLSDAAHREAVISGRSVRPSLLLGMATGLLWAPCAGPILGLVLTTAALQGASVHTALLLTAYATGATTSLALAVWVGGRFFAAMKRSFRIGEWLRRSLGVAVLAAVTAVALDLDTGLIAHLSPDSSNVFEQHLLDRWQGQRPPRADRSMEPRWTDYLPEIIAPAFAATEALSATPVELPVEGHLPDLSGAVAWLNSPPLSAQSLRGKVVLIDIWALGCINCQRVLPHVRTWAEKYKKEGLVVIGVHAPEFAYERKIDNVKRAAEKLDLTFPIAIDNNFTIWNSFSNQYWPSNYFIDVQGRIRFHHFGEGEYERSEQVIQQLLAEANSAGK